MSLTEDVEYLLCWLYEFEEERELTSQAGGTINTKSAAATLKWAPSRINRVISYLDERGLLKTEKYLGTAPFKTHGFMLNEEGRIQCERQGLTSTKDAIEAAPSETLQNRAVPTPGSIEPYTRARSVLQYLYELFLKDPGADSFLAVEGEPDEMDDDFGFTNGELEHACEILVTKGLARRRGMRAYAVSTEGISAVDNPALLDRELPLRGVAVRKNEAVSAANDPPDAGSPSATQKMIPMSLVTGTRPYIEKIANQINGAYEHGWFDAAAVMIRRLVETLIIEAFERHKLADKIKNEHGDFFYLRDLVSRTLSESSWNLGRNVKQALPKLKDVGDKSAHSRRYLAHRSDIDDIRDYLRVVVQELLFIAELKK